MYKRLFFLDSKTLDWLTPYILVLASDTIAFNVFVLTFVSVVAFLFPKPHAIFNGYLFRGWLCGRILVTQMVCFGKVRAKG
ncbi:BlpZ protein, fusion [Streptococcus mitis]|uniref:BlpZ protein, fusion n=1 Tax=Streptococcus mitis TaxID=28037 RepID=A0A139PZQ4_STRMT|nr:BlpZ protein, fusion [Streptococcus mitis]